MFEVCVTVRVKQYLIIYVKSKSGSVVYSNNGV